MDELYFTSECYNRTYDYSTDYFSAPEDFITAEKFFKKLNEIQNGWIDDYGILE